ncbi:MAG: hypothetical protein ACLFNI_03490 [Natronomonas sp.]
MRRYGWINRDEDEERESRAPDNPTCGDERVLLFAVATRKASVRHTMVGRDA